jgi:hypothetical protein
MAEERSSDIAQRINHLSAWVDASIAMGLSGWSQEHFSAGRMHADRMGQVGLAELKQALSRVLDAAPDDRADLFGQLLVVLDMTQERTMLDEPWPIEEAT